MGSVDRVDDRTFKVNLTGDSVIKLRDSVGEKLKEFIGDYTDETLVEYVIVLLKNGRRKEDVKNELDVFLGDASDSFVSWLWDHLASNTGSHFEDASIRKAESGDKTGKNDSHHLGPVSFKVKSNKSSKSRHNREWRGLAWDAAEPPPLLSSELGCTQVEETSRNRVSRAKSPSLQPTAQRKRNWSDEWQHSKREVSSLVNIGAPCRLHKSAIYDSLTTSWQSSLTTEPTLKHLCSVVSTSTGDTSLVDPPRWLQSVVRVPNSIATVMQAVAEATEDVTRINSSGEIVPDLMGHGTTVIVIRLRRGIIFLVDSRSSCKTVFPGTDTRVKRIESDIEEKFKVVSKGVYIAGAGSASRYRTVHEFLVYLFNSGHTRIEELQSAAQFYLQFVPLPQNSAPLTVLIGGWSDESKGYVVYKVGDQLEHAELVQEVYVAVGSGKGAALMYLERENLHIDMDVELALAGGRRAILRSATIDPSSGGFLRGYVGTTVGAEERWFRHTINAISDSAVFPPNKLYILLPALNRLDLSVWLRSQLPSCIHSQCLGDVRDNHHLYLVTFTSESSATKMLESCTRLTDFLRVRWIHVPYCPWPQVAYVGLGSQDFLARVFLGFDLLADWSF